MPCGAHCFILYLQASFPLSPPLTFHAENALKAGQLLLLPDGLYGLYATHSSWHPEEGKSNQATCVPLFLTGTIPSPQHTAEMPAAAAPSAAAHSKLIHCVTSRWKEAAVLSVHK